jgi:hypothetical protein
MSAERPTSVTVFGILNIVFAVLGLFGLLATIALFSVSGASNNPVVQIIREKPIYAMWLKLTIPLGLLSCAVLLGAGIGLLFMKSWGRTASIGYAVYAIVVGLVSILMNLTFLLPPMLEHARQAQGPEAAGAIGGAVGASLGGFFGLIYPILLLIFMTRPRVSAAFQTDAPPPVPMA